MPSDAITEKPITIHDLADALRTTRVRIENFPDEDVRRMALQQFIEILSEQLDLGPQTVRYLLGGE